MPVILGICAALLLAVSPQSVFASRAHVLSAEDIAALRSEMPGSAEGETVRFTATFGPQEQLSRRDRRRHENAGTVPFHITADFASERVANNRTLSRRLPGMVHMYVLDADGKVVASQSMQVERMCPT